MYRIRLPIILLAAACGAAWAAPEDEKIDPVFEQAKQAIEDGDYDVALALMDKAAAQSPKEAKYRGLRGTALLCKGEYARGEADLKAAVGLNPGDAGAGYRPSSEAKLAEERLRHGRLQVERMLSDRPAMNQYGGETDFLRRWAERKFAGEDFGSPIDWDPTPPLHSDAEHLAPDEDSNAAILIEGRYHAGQNRGKQRSFEELWAGAVYELHNVAFAREFVRLHEKAEKGTITKEDFVGGILKHELSAAQQTRAFYLHVFLPWLAKKKLPTDPTLWFCEWWDSPESVLDSFTDKAAYPWRPYGREYDWFAVHRFWLDGEHEKNHELLKRMSAEEGYEEERPDVMYWSGLCLAKLGRPAEAVAALDESIRLDPEHAAAYRARGNLHKQLGASAKAEADFAKAKALEGGE